MMKKLPLRCRRVFGFIASGYRTPRLAWPLVSGLLLLQPVDLLAQVYNEVDGLVIMEAENTPSAYGEWALDTSTDVDHTTGSGSLAFTGNSPINGPPGSPLEYTFKINRSGIYYLDLHCARETLVINDKTRTDVANDGYIRVDGDYEARSPNPNDTPDDSGKYAKAYHSEDAPLAVLQSDYKYFGGGDNHFLWQSGNRIDLGGHKNKRVAVYDFKAGETYTLVIHGRSQRFKINRIIFRHEDVNAETARTLSNPESPMVADGSAALSTDQMH